MNIESVRLYITAAVRSTANALINMQTTGHAILSVQRVLYGSATKMTWHMFLKLVAARFRQAIQETGLLHAHQLSRNACLPKNQK